MKLQRIIIFLFAMSLGSQSLSAFSFKLNKLSGTTMAVAALSLLGWNAYRCGENDISCPIDRKHTANNFLKLCGVSTALTVLLMLKNRG